MDYTKTTTPIADTPKKRGRPPTKTRVSREQETWDNIDFREEDLNLNVASGPLPEIKARPGFKQRWIRTKAAGQDDHQNLSKAFNQHWRRRSPDTIPKNVSAPTIYVEGVGEAIGLSGMILMERPDKISAAYRQRVTDSTRAQETAVRSQLRGTGAEGGFGQPKLVENKSEVKIGGALTVDD